MKIALLTTCLCGAGLLIALAAQNRGFDLQNAVSPVESTLDADHDGTLSAAEIRSAPAALKHLDANGDGRLTPEELRPSFAGRRGGGGPFGRDGGRGDERDGGAAASADDLADTLMAFDRNGDGNLVRAELPERFQGLFDRSDTNKDGALTRDELKQTATATVQEGAGRGRGGRGRGGPRLDPLVRSLDIDGDGTLSEPEITAAAASVKKLDTNGDGQLSPEEFRVPSGRGREERR